MSFDQFVVHIITIRKHQSFEMRIALDFGGKGMNSDEATLPHAHIHFDSVWALDAHGGWNNASDLKYIKKQFLSSL